MQILLHMKNDLLVKLWVHANDIGGQLDALEEDLCCAWEWKTLSSNWIGQAPSSLNSYLSVLDDVRPGMPSCLESLSSLV